MGRKIYHRIRIDSIENQIALWELRGHDLMAQGLRLFFKDVISDPNIEARKVELAQANGIDYAPQGELPAAGSGRKTHQYKEGTTWEETRTVRNRKGGKTYKYRYRVTIVNGKRKSEVIGRVGGE